MIRHHTLTSSKAWVGFQKKDKSYTFLHWLDHNDTTSRFKWLKYSRTLKEYSAVGPTLLVEWQDE